MRLVQLKYRILFILIVIAPGVPASSSRLKTADSNLTLVPISYISQNLQTNVYTPDFISSADSVIVPLKRAGRLFLIDAKVGDETGNLVFDSGANGLVLNSVYFRNQVRSGGSTPTGVTGAVGAVEQIFVKQIALADLSYKNVMADVTDLGHLENRRGVKILGLFGFSMMRKLEIVIDAKNNQLKLFRIDNSGKRLNRSLSEFKADYIQKLEGNSNIVFLKGKISGKTLNFCFDTGCETNVICSDCNRSIMNTLTITRRSGLTGAGSSGSEVLFGRMNDFMIGDKQIPNMDTVITNLDALSESYGTKLDGMLGYNFLEQGIICINFVKRQFGIRFIKG
jgi:predicted transcriptional regulator with HTH domain